MSKLVIVESPAKATTIKKYLGRGYDVKASMGHLRDLPKSQMGIDIEHGFEPKYINIRGKGPVINDLKKSAKSAKEIYLATDPDREGEAISWHLANILGLDVDKTQRVTFNEITKAGVTSGMQSPRKIDMDLVDAQQARRVLDRIVGYKLSPILWAKVKKGLSAGRVQSVAARLVVERDREIEAFEPQEYWTITTKYRGSSPKRSFSAKYYGTGTKKVDLQNKEQADGVLETIKGADHIVKGVKRAKKQKSPAPPFITSTLQQEVSRRLNLQPRQTMSIAQELYEGISIGQGGVTGLITYMRTDSLRVSDEAISAVRDYIKGEYGNEYCCEKPRVFKSKSGAQDAHEAIRPTSMENTPQKVKQYLNNYQFRVYKLIWDRFVASQMENMTYEAVTVDIDAAGCIFRAVGNTVKFKGYTALYEEKSDTGEETPNKELPLVNEGDILDLLDVIPEQKFTQPPLHYTEASLIRALEENGIGRPSTYAPTITTITSRGYVVRRGKSLISTPLGQVTTDLMIKYFPNIVDVDFTADMEKELDEVEDGKIAWRDVISEFYEGFDSTVKKAEESLEGVHMKVEDEESDVICEKCGRKMVYKMGKYGRFLACPGFPECRNTKTIVETIDVPCPICGGKVLVKKTKKGSKFYVCEHGPQCTFISWDEPINEKCPKCGSMLARKTRWQKKVVCTNENCDYERLGK